MTPTLVCECAFSEWTRDGSMRHPRFLGLREDKTPLECVREERVPGAAAAPAGPGADTDVAPEGRDSTGVAGAATPARTAPKVPRTDNGAPSPSGESPRAPSHRDGPKLANPDKVLFPRDGITKREIWDYYTAIAPQMLPHMAGRPLTLQRYPNGIDEAEWYQQNAPEKTPDFVRLVDSGPRHDHKKRIVCDNVETLQWLANLAALTMHAGPRT